MDERQLSELFRDAAEGGPPASFGHADVVARSRRITARRRMAAAGSALGLVVVLGGGFVVGSDLLRGGDGGAGQTTPAEVAEQPREAAPYDQASPPTADTGDLAAVPDSSRVSGKVVPFPGLRDDSAHTPCGPVDPALGDALAREIPETTRPTAVPDACPPGARSAALPVPGGSLYVVLAPAQADPAIDAPLRRIDGAIGHAARTTNGQALVVVSVPAVDGGTPPYADRLPSIAAKIAQRY